MEDPRIRKTKKRLKETLFAMLADMPFDHVTVSELCRRAHASRITFYTYYSDKYSLTDEIFDDMLATATEDFSRMEGKGCDDPADSFCHLLDAILNLAAAWPDFFRHITQNENPYLYYCFYRTILLNVEKFGLDHCEGMKPRYSMPQAASFLCDGLWGFIRTGREQGKREPEIRAEAESLLRNMLKSGLLAVPG